MGKRLSRQTTTEIVARRPQPAAMLPAAHPSPKADDVQAAKAPGLIESISSKDKERRQAGALYVFTQGLGGGVMQRQLGPLLDERLSAGATEFVGAIVASVKPRDLVEQMLCVQMAWTHARIARLSSSAATQENLKSFAVVHQAADAATNTFRRLMLALADYRAPRRGEGFTAVKNQYNANQQVVQNGNPENGTATNEQGLPAVRPAPVPALPPVADGPGVPAAVGAARAAVAVEHGAEHGGWEGASEPERDPTRRAVGGPGGGDAGDRRADAPCP